MVPSFFFLLIFAYITNWVRVKYSVSKFFLGTASNTPPQKLTDTTLIQKYKRKTGITFDIRIFDSPFISAAMMGLPIKPVMVISSTALKKFSVDELDWIICHEAGHCVKWHLLVNLVMWLIVCSVGIYIVSHFSFSSLIAGAFGMLLSIIYLQLERFFSEYQADLYALHNVDSLDGMINANKKMKAFVTSPFYRYPLLTFLFTQHLTYDQRIAMALRAKQS